MLIRYLSLCLDSRNKFDLNCFNGRLINTSLPNFKMCSLSLLCLLQKMFDGNINLQSKICYMFLRQNMFFIYLHITYSKHYIYIYIQTTGFFFFQFAWTQPAIFSNLSQGYIILIQCKCFN
jgi:hypothetical protein